MDERKREESAGWRVRLGVSLAVFLCGSAACGCRALPRKADARERADKVGAYRAEAERLRGLPLAHEVALARETREELQGAMEKELDKAENRAFMDEAELMLRQSRLLGEGAELRTVFLDLMRQQVAAYYDPEAKRLAYVEEAPSEGKGREAGELPGMERFVYVHEFCHAIEDSHFDLDGLGKAAMGDLDRNLALTSFVEGNAVLTGIDGLLEEYGFPVNTATPLGAWMVGLMGSVKVEDKAAEFEGVPPFLAGALLRPYLDGAVFSNRIRREAGWQAVDAAYRERLPQTTAEILYPERRYLKEFKAAAFEPDARLFAAARQGVSTNSFGAMGTALWLGGEELVTPRAFGFLKGWLGDRAYFIKGDGGRVQTVWVSLWERPSMARAFASAAEQRMARAFADVAWRVRREGRLVAVVWDISAAADGQLDALAHYALRTRVEAEIPARGASWANDLPWPVRFPGYEGYSGGCEILGGYVADVCGGEAFFRVTLAGGLGLRAESNPDRHYYGLAWGLLRHVGDARSDFTYWSVPLLAAWHRRGSGEQERYRWSVLWGFLADGDERRARVLLVPVWRKKSQ